MSRMPSHIYYAICVSMSRLLPSIFSLVLLVTACEWSLRT